ncbi:MAG: transposase [Bacteroidetes bacterium]|nr:transposase [Bacteroidota bacterium]
MKTLFVGIDVSKLWLDLSVTGEIGIETHLRIDNNLSGFKKAIQWLKKMKKQEEWFICMEHTGVYAQPLWYFLKEKGIEYSVVSGSVISSGLSIKRGKNDKLDALTIARFAKRYSDELTPHKLPAQLLRRLKTLFAYRERLVKAKVILEVPAGESKNYAEQDSKEMCNETSEVVAYLNSRIKRVEKLMLELVKSDEQTSECFKLILSVPGFGIITASYLLIITECFTLFSNSRQIACYSGIAPFEHSSGSSIKGKTRVSAKADKKLKGLLSRGVSTLLLHHAPTKQYFEKKIAQGKHQNLVRNNLKNKMLHTVFAVVRKATPYDPLYSLDFPSAA